jgi:hypothetical protein
MIATAPITTLPRRQHLLALGLWVAALHLFLLMSSTHFWRLQDESPQTGPLQTRVISAESVKTDNTPTKKPPSTAIAKPPIPAPQPIAIKPNNTDAGMQATASAALPAPPESANELPVTTDMQTSEVTSNAPQTPALEPSAETSPQKATQAPLTQWAKLVNFPDSTQINYRLTGQERGLTYHATGALKWQVKAGADLPKAYEAELRVRAFLVGNRVWRSVGQLSDGGLAPKRYSDSWRGERAAHFETDEQKISFSGNLPSAPLLPGAQDQVSLFIQMAAAVASQNFTTGAELTIQTATARDAVNWTLTYKADEFIDVNGDRLETQRWLCLPRGKFDSQIEMWLAKSLAGLPARIKITQVSGNFIDMEMRSSEPLPPLEN